MLAIFLFLLLPSLSPLASGFKFKSHQFYALEDVAVVSKSSSIQKLNECKNECLTMKEFFPFRFKYHRYILRQNVGSNKYFQGNCLFSLPDEESWFQWEKLRVFIAQTTLFVDMSQMQRWISFRDKCEDKTLKIDQSTLKSLDFTRVHSNFQYYDNGTFTNLEPFDDLQNMLNNLGGYIK